MAEREISKITYKRNTKRNIEEGRPFKQVKINDINNTNKTNNKLNTTTKLQKKKSEEH